MNPPPEDKSAPQRTQAASTAGIPFVFSAPSGTGKTTVCQHLRSLLPNLRFSISHTTRPPRPGEVDGRDYFFVTREAFEKNIAEGELLEWARVFDNRDDGGKENVVLAPVLDAPFPSGVDVDPFPVTLCDFWFLCPRPI